MYSKMQHTQRMLISVAIPAFGKIIGGARPPTKTLEGPVAPLAPPFPTPMCTHILYYLEGTASLELKACKRLIETRLVSHKQTN